MNIFFLDWDVKKCAEYHCDKHIVKMILETAQLLCGVHHMTPQVDPLSNPSSNRPSNRPSTVQVVTQKSSLRNMGKREFI